MHHRYLVKNDVPENGTKVCNWVISRTIAEAGRLPDPDAWLARAWRCRRFCRRPITEGGPGSMVMDNNYQESLHYSIERETRSCNLLRRMHAGSDFTELREGEKPLRRSPCLPMILPETRRWAINGLWTAKLKAAWRSVQQFA